ncbi:MAG: CpaF family protein [Acidimicrobiia bacterium]|nr:CpaF family protein [Acidimicrobiia bacterium]
MSTELKQRVHERLLRAPELVELAQADGQRAVRARLAELLRDEDPLLPVVHFERLLSELTDEVAGLGPLEPLLAAPDVTEVMVNGPGHAYVERAGRLERIDLDLDAAGIARLVERVVAPLGLRLDRSSPMVDARLPDGSRLHAILPPLAIDGPCVTIRRFGARAVPLEAFGLDDAAQAFLRWCVEVGWNLVVAGATSAGKTTLLNALSGAIPLGERVVTIEETAELRLAQPHVVRLEARPPNAEGAGAVPVRALVRAALRMRPDRVVVGEVRGGEAFDMLQALNTGHDGSLSTVHANSAADALTRLETLVLLADTGLPLVAVRSQLAAALDGVVFVARRAGGNRRVEEVAELVVTPEGPAVRALFSWRDGRLAPTATPTRAPRRPDAPSPDSEWFACTR